MDNYESAVYITRDYEMPWGFLILHLKLWKKNL